MSATRSSTKKLGTDKTWDYIVVLLIHNSYSYSYIIDALKKA